jgi:hypothetical protein
MNVIYPSTAPDEGLTLTNGQRLTAREQPRYVRRAARVVRWFWRVWRALVGDRVRS